MNEKANLKIYIRWQMEFIHFSKTQIEKYRADGYSDDYSEIVLYKYLIEEYHKRIRQSQLELSIIAEKGKW